MIIIYCCRDCGDRIHKRTALNGLGRCYHCANIGILNPYYKNGLTKIKNYCKDCNCLISIGSIRCNKCSKQTLIHPSYINGKPKCIDCNKILSDYHCKRCTICFHKWLSGENHPRFGKPPNSFRYGYYKNIFMRSSYELNFAQFLDLSNIKWLYEAKTFNLGNTTYTPDFYLPEFDCYIEIKGYWYPKTLNKFHIFKRIYKNINIKVFNNIFLKETGII